MNPWVIILLVMAAAVYGIDYLVRRKKWHANSKEEKISLLINMFSVGFYAFLSALGLLWVIATSIPKTALGQVIYDATLTMGEVYYMIAIATVIGSFILRAKGKVKASIWIHIIAFVYIVAVLGVNYLAGELL